MTARTSAAQSRGGTALTVADSVVVTASMVTFSGFVFYFAGNLVPFSIQPETEPAPAEECLPSVQNVTDAKWGDTAYDLWLAKTVSLFMTMLAPLMLALTGLYIHFAFKGYRIMKMLACISLLFWTALVLVSIALQVQTFPIVCYTSQLSAVLANIFLVLSFSTFFGCFWFLGVGLHYNYKENSPRAGSTPEEALPLLPRSAKCPTPAVR